MGYTTPKIFMEELLNPVPPDIKVFVYLRQARFVNIVWSRYGDYGTAFYDMELSRLPCYWNDPTLENFSSRPLYEAKHQGDELASQIRAHRQVERLRDMSENFAADVDLDLVRV